MNKKIEAIAESVANGNFTQARNQAKVVSWERIYKYLRDELCYSEDNAREVADKAKSKKGCL